MNQCYAFGNGNNGTKDYVAHNSNSMYRFDICISLNKQHAGIYTTYLGYETVISMFPLLYGSHDTAS